MKKRVLNAAFFEKNMPPATQAFERDTAALLQALANSMEEKPMKKKWLTAAVVTALLVALLAATALAIGLLQSARYSALKRARDTLMEKYGLSQSALAAFEEAAEEDGDALLVTYEPIKFETEAMGRYSAKVTGDKAEVTWTHDGTDPSVYESGALDAPVWGTKQIEATLEIEWEYTAALRELTKIEDSDARIEKIRELQANAPAVLGLVIPQASVTVPTEKAVEIAREDVTRVFGIPKEEVDALHVTTELFQNQNEQSPTYTVFLTYDKVILGVPMSGFMVRVDGLTGEATWNFWMIEPEDRTLPDGPLDSYEKAVQKFIEEGAFDLCDPAKKADIGTRIIQAGFGDLLPHADYAVPPKDGVSEAEAVAAANRHMAEHFGVTETSLAFFKTSVSFIAGERPHWAINYIADDGEDFMMYYDKFGEYSVHVDGKTAEIIESAWSFADALGGKAYAESSWGQAPAYDGRMLTWLSDLLAAEAALYAKYDEEWKLHWNVEDSGVRSALFRDAGFDPAMYPYHVPGPDDMPQAEAETYARQLLKDEYGLTDQRLDNPGDLLVSFRVRDPEKLVWNFRYTLTDDGREDCYTVEFDAKTREVTQMSYIATGNG